MITQLKNVSAVPFGVGIRYGISRILDISQAI